MITKDQWIEDQTKALEKRQAGLIAQGTPDEFIPIQIAQLGNVWDTTHQSRKISGKGED